MKHGEWATSCDGEYFHGSYAIREDAIGEMDAGDYVGRLQTPPSPESYIEADLLIEHILCQDDYSHDWAEGTLSASKEQLDELTVNLRRVFGEWIDKHGLRPGFFLVVDSEQLSADEIDEELQRIREATP